MTRVVPKHSRRGASSLSALSPANLRQLRRRPEAVGRRGSIPATSTQLTHYLFAAGVTVALMAMGREQDQVVDSRFALANERTLLAWSRTALALLASGGAVQQLSDLPAHTALAILLGVAGIAAAVTGGWRYRQMAAALRRGDGPLPGRAPVALAAGIAVIGIVLVIAIAAS